MKGKWLRFATGWNAEILIPPQKVAGFMELMRHCIVAEEKYEPGEGHDKIWVEGDSPRIEYIDDPNPVLDRKAYKEWFDAVEEEKQKKEEEENAETDA